MVSLLKQRGIYRYLPSLLCEKEFDQRMFSGHNALNTSKEHFYFPNIKCPYIVDLPDDMEDYAVPLSPPIQLVEMVSPKYFLKEWQRLQELYGAGNVFIEWGIWNWVS